MEFEIYKDANGELYHWGVRGMRWGVRRYQNKDGSLTDKGKKRLRAEQAKVREEEKTLKNRQAVKARLDRLEARKKAVEEGNKALDEAEGKVKKDAKAKKGKGSEEKKSIKDMTDEELLRAVNRSRLEDQYNQLNPEPTRKQGLLKKMVNEAVVPAAVSSGKKFLENALNKAAEKALGDKVDPDSYEALKKTYDKLKVQMDIDKLKNPEKYLSEEDKNKRAEREQKGRDRESKLKGFADEADEARAKREAQAAETKRQADEAARKANEAKSKEYYNSTYNTGSVDKKYRTEDVSADREYVKTGQKQIATALKSLPSTTSALPSPTVNSGKQAVLDVLDKNGNVIYTRWSDDD